ncbi:Os06g0686550 [Oryza sativa Japonica Group]|uniref:Os06g0686550 protein n=1 Tax=Oryza sativa subsp. japonica TaxID=39947 RepID=A0A0P0X0K2_ORYSJ|nr:hypothetical protein EE612_036145 [Oryza sativa]BAS99195.1 Os06g0686550 [Oryza sativa Japonica Group]
MALHISWNARSWIYIHKTWFVHNIFTELSTQLGNLKVQMINMFEPTFRKMNSPFLKVNTQGGGCPSSFLCEHDTFALSFKYCIVQSSIGIQILHRITGKKEI